VKPGPRLGLSAWVAGVATAHLLGLQGLRPDRLGPGVADTATRRIEVSWVQTLQPSAPPEQPPVAATPPPRERGRVHRLSSAALEPAAAPASAPEDRQDMAALSPTEAEPLADSALPPLAAAAETVESAPSAPAFEWPPSTRLSYSVLGHFRGPAEGQAVVEWLREGSRYEVRMTLSIGPAFAPLASRTVRSEGTIDAEGLQPRRYDEETRALLTDTRRLVIELGEQSIRLPGGQVVDRPAGVQDSASQFVQLTWMFTLRPDLLTPGTTIELPLALPRRVEPWLFDVVGPETLATGAGAIDTVHVKPRREARPGSDLTAEVWIAPTLQYLPVRIVIRQSAEAWLDLELKTLPQQAAPSTPAAATPALPAR